MVAFTIFLKKLIYLLLFFGCAGSLLLRVGFLNLQRAWTTFHCSAQASHCGDSCYGAQAQQLWLMGLAAPGPIISWQIDGKTMETVTDFIFLGSKSLQTPDHCMTSAMKLKDVCSLEEKLWTT